MRLNKPQAKVFDHLRQFRSRPPSFANQLRRYWWLYLLLLLFAAGTVALGYAMKSDFVSGFGVGVVLAIIMKDEAGTRQFAILWPALEAVYDWTKIDQLLEERRIRLAQSQSPSRSATDPKA
jgi:hypothetical protein